MSPMTGNCTWLGLLTGWVFVFFFFPPFVFLEIPSFSGALFKQIYGKFGAISLLEIVIPTSIPSPCQVPFCALVRVRRWWCEVISHDGTGLHLVTDGSDTLGDKEGLFEKRTPEILLSVGGEKVTVKSHG